jgi:DNA-binding MarR family transcriptional regulator
MAAKAKIKDSHSPAQIAMDLERLARLIRQASHAQGLKPVQWEALRYLARANRFSNSPLALSKYLGTTKGTVSQSLLVLEKKGLVSKTDREGNQRSISLEITEAGQAALRLDPKLGLTNDVEALKPKIKKRFAKGLRELLDAERQRQHQPNFGPCGVCRYFRERRQVDVKAPHWCMNFEQPLTQAESTLICVEQVED